MLYVLSIIGVFFWSCSHSYWLSCSMHYCRRGCPWPGSTLFLSIRTKRMIYSLMLSLKSISYAFKTLKQISNKSVRIQLHFKPQSFRMILMVIIHANQHPTQGSGIFVHVHQCLFQFNTLNPSSYHI